MTEALMFVPCIPAPKGSSRAAQIPIKGARKCRVCQNIPKQVVWLPGSADGTAKKQKEMEKAVREAISNYIFLENWVPLETASRLDAHFIFPTPAARRKELHHCTYPDRDKLLRELCDCISPPKKKKVPDLSVPHLIVNDSMIVSGETSKYWFHAYPDEWGLGIKEPGVAFKLQPL